MPSGGRTVAEGWFRDVHGVKARLASRLSAGVGTDSRIYKTEDGGAIRMLQFQSEDPTGFYDCFTFLHRAARSR